MATCYVKKFDGDIGWSTKEGNVVAGKDTAKSCVLGVAGHFAPNYIAFADAARELDMPVTVVNAIGRVDARIGKESDIDLIKQFGKRIGVRVVVKKP